MIHGEDADNISNTIAKYLSILFEPDQDYKFGERGREWAWRWGYWGRVLSVLYCATRDPALLQLFEKVHQQLVDRRDDRLGLVDDIRDKVLTSWGTRLRGKNDKGLRSCEIETTGLLLLPFTDLLLRSEGHLPQSFREKLINTVRLGLEAHLGELVEHPASGGGYFNSPWTGGIEPLNHSHLYAAVATEAFAITGDKDFLDIAQKVYRFFQHNWFREENYTISWAYAPTTTNKNMKHDQQNYGLKSFSHTLGAELFYKAGVTIELPLAMNRVGLVSKDDLTLIASSLSKNVFLGDSQISCYISPRKHLPDDIARQEGKLIRPAAICTYYRLVPFHPELGKKLDTFISTRSDWFPRGLKAGTAQLLAFALLKFG